MQNIDPIINVPGIPFTPCAPQIKLSHGVIAQLVLEACLNNNDIITNDPNAYFLGNFACETAFEQGILDNVAGCWVQRPSNGQCDNSVTTSTPTCFYRIQSKDNNPAGDCRRASQV